MWGNGCPAGPFLQLHPSGLLPLSPAAPPWGSNAVYGSMEWLDAWGGGAVLGTVVLMAPAQGACLGEAAPLSWCALDIVQWLGHGLPKAEAAGVWLGPYNILCVRNRKGLAVWEPGLQGFLLAVTDLLRTHSCASVCPPGDQKVPQDSIEMLALSQGHRATPQKWAVAVGVSSPPISGAGPPVPLASFWELIMGIKSFTPNKIPTASTSRQSLERQAGGNSLYTLPCPHQL